MRISNFMIFKIYNITRHNGAQSSNFDWTRGRAYSVNKNVFIYMGEDDHKFLWSTDNDIVNFYIAFSKYLMFNFFVSD